MPVLFVTGHLRNFYSNPKHFIESHLSRFACERKVLFTHNELGWWTGDMSKTLTADDTSVDRQRLVDCGFFDLVEFIDLKDRDKIVADYKVLPVCTERPYYREPSYKMQIVHRYLALRQYLSAQPYINDDIIVLTRPDIFPHSAESINYINDAIAKFKKTNKELLVFSQMKDHLHDGVMIGRSSHLLRLFSAEVYNTRTSVDTHKNLFDICNELFDAEILHLNESFYYANSPNMRQY